MDYIKNKRNEYDRCNICGRQSHLTWDHVPPKGVLIERNTIANTLFCEEGFPSNDRHMRRYQSGIKYRTICRECNNVLLGENDKAYKQFAKEAAEQISDIQAKFSQGLSVPQGLVMEGKINRILRAICGHFLAMKEIYDEQVVIDQYLREYILNEQMVLKKIKVYCWVYPYSTILNVRDVVVQGKNDNTHPKGMISVMAAYPLGFLISLEDETCCSIDNISSYSSEEIDEVVAVRLNLNTAYYCETKKLKHYLWPTNISDDQYGIWGALGDGRIMEGSRIGVTIPK